MKVSLCITTFNEEKSIGKLLDSISVQTRKPDEIIIVDGGSKDKTVEIIQSYERIRLIISKGASIAKGRNIAVKNAKYPIIAMTDAGCVCEKHWFERISLDEDVTAGFYKMTGNSDFQIALKLFLGIMPEKFDPKSFLPSTRSITFRKSVWKKVGGFNEKLDRAGEDTQFNIQIINHKFQIVRVRNAIVYWEMPNTFFDAAKKFFYYARGDAQMGITTSHNIRVLTIFLRYIIFIFIWPLFFVYLLFPIWKFRKYNFDWLTRFWTVIIQLISDFSVMLGFIAGLI